MVRSEKKGRLCATGAEHRKSLVELLLWTWNFGIMSSFEDSGLTM